MNDKTGQRQYKFSLSVRDKHNRQVKKIVDGLLQKGRGALSQSIRDALRLLNDLRRGNTKVLLEMFPDIVDKLCPSTPPTDDIADLKRMIEQLQRKVDSQQTVYVPADNIPDTRDVGFPAMKQVGKGIGHAAAPKLASGGTLSAPRAFTAAPDDDDDDDTVIITQATNTRVDASAMASLLKIAF
jgi:hypothetical protein